VTRNVLFLIIPQKRDFMNPARDGGGTPRKWQNSAKSEKVGLSAFMIVKVIYW